MISKGLASNNTSGFRGVSWNSQYRKWKASIGRHPRLFLGYYDDPVEAAHAYDRAAREYFGSLYGAFNFPQGNENGAAS